MLAWLYTRLMRLRASWRGPGTSVGWR